MKNVENTKKRLPDMLYDMLVCVSRLPVKPLECFVAAWSMLGSDYLEPVLQKVCAVAWRTCVV